MGGLEILGLVKEGAGVLGGLGGIFGRSKMDSSSATSGASNASVFGDTFFGDSGINKPTLDLSNPVHVGVLLAAVAVGVIVFKKVVK